MADDNKPGAGDQATDNKSEGEQTGQKKGKSRRKWYLIGLALIFVIIAVVYAIYYFTVAQFYAETDDAYIHGNRILLTPQINGTVVAIHADDTDLVHAGDTVIELDPTNENIALQRSSARLAEVVRNVHQLFLRATRQQAVIKQQQTAMEQARRDYNRDARLIKVHGVTQQAFEKSRSTYEQDEASLKAARDQLSSLKAQTDGTTLQTHPQVRQAEAALRNAYLDLRRTRIPAPVTGYIAQRDVQLGQRVDPSKPMLSIVPVDQIWVNANFKETEMAAMRIGQPATVTADFYGSNVIYHGRIAGISAGTGAAFELLPPQNATGNWIKIVRRVPVRVVLNPNDLAHHPLRIGLSMDVTVNLHNVNGLMLANRSPAKPRYQTRIYQQRMHGADRLIAQIVAANDGQSDDSTSAAAASPRYRMDDHAPEHGS